MLALAALVVLAGPKPVDREFFCFTDDRRKVAFVRDVRVQRDDAFVLLTGTGAFPARASGNDAPYAFASFTPPLPHAVTLVVDSAGTSTGRACDAGTPCLAVKGDVDRSRVGNVARSANAALVARAQKLYAKTGWHADSGGDVWRIRLPRRKAADLWLVVIEGYPPNAQNVDLQTSGTGFLFGDAPDFRLLMQHRGWTSPGPVLDLDGDGNVEMDVESCGGDSCSDSIWIFDGRTFVGGPFELLDWGG